MDVDMETKMDVDSMVANKSPKRPQGKVAHKIKSPKFARKTVTNTVAKTQSAPKKKDGMKKDAMKAKDKPKPKPKAKTVVETPTKGKSTAEMVYEALVNLKSRKGITMASIRNYLQQQYDVYGKRRHGLIKDALKELFETGELGNLEPNNENDLKFNKRFWFTPNK